MQDAFVYSILVAVVGGIIAFLVHRASFIDAEFKQIALWLILVAVVILIAITLIPAILALV